MKKVEWFLVKWYRFIVYKLVFLFPVWNIKARWMTEYSAYTVFPWIVLRGDRYYGQPEGHRKVIDNHELIHMAQALEWLPVAFISIISLPWYMGVILLFGQPIVRIIHQVVIRLKGGSSLDAYWDLCTEEEAHNEEVYFDYIKNQRVPFGYIHFDWEPDSEY